MKPPVNPSPVHRIRLHGLWQCESASQVDAFLKSGADEKRKVQLPIKLDQLQDDSLATKVKLSRAFNCPTSLNADQKVWLVVESTGVAGQAFLNDRHLDQFDAGGMRAEISQQLRQHNCLHMELVSSRDQANAAEIQSVRLEIEE